VVGGLAALVALVAGSTYVGVRLLGEEEKPTEKRVHVKAKRVVNGHYVKLDKDDKLVYAGIRAPYENEPFHLEAKQRNEELVVGKELRLRFDRDKTRDRKGRLFAYAFFEGSLINEVMVRDGMAYVRLTPETVRYADALLQAQAEARRARRGLWSQVAKSDESIYVADPKYGNFHRPSCESVPNITQERRLELPSRKDAFDQGFAPCNKCLP
jgi:micrococcal nuclease